MLEALMKIFGKNEKPSGQVAKERLRVVLIHDRASVSPELMEVIKNEIINVLSKYMDVQKKGIEISLANDDDSVALVANIPVNNMRHGVINRAWFCQYNKIPVDYLSAVFLFELSSSWQFNYKSKVSFFIYKFKWLM